MSFKFWLNNCIVKYSQSETFFVCFLKLFLRALSTAGRNECISIVRCYKWMYHLVSFLIYFSGILCFLWIGAPISFLTGTPRYWVLVSNTLIYLQCSTNVSVVPSFLPGVHFSMCTVYKAFWMFHHYPCFSWSDVIQHANIIIDSFLS